MVRNSPAFELGLGLHPLPSSWRDAVSGRLCSITDLAGRPERIHRWIGAMLLHTWDSAARSLVLFGYYLPSADLDLPVPRVDLCRKQSLVKSLRPGSSMARYGYGTDQGSSDMKHYGLRLYAAFSFVHALRSYVNGQKSARLMESFFHGQEDCVLSHLPYITNVKCNNQLTG
jgi:hypothetical protein